MPHGILPTVSDDASDAPPILGRRPTVYREEDPLLHVLLNRPDALPRPLNPQRSGPFFDAVSQLMGESPKLGGRIGEVFLRRIQEPHVLGEPAIGKPPYPTNELGEWRRNSMQIDPSRLPGTGLTPLDVIKHELTHLLGYGEDEAYEVSGYPKTSPDPNTPKN